MTTGTARTSIVGFGAAWVRLASVGAEVAVSAPIVVTRRLVVLSTGGRRRRRREADRMVREKAAAVGEILVVAATAWPRLPMDAALSALAPVHRRVAGNRRRLSRH